MCCFLASVVSMPAWELQYPKGRIWEMMRFLRWQPKLGECLLLSTRFGSFTAWSPSPQLCIRTCGFRALRTLPLKLQNRDLNSHSCAKRKVSLDIWLRRRVILKIDVTNTWYFLKLPFRLSVACEYSMIIHPKCQFCYYLLSLKPVWLYFTGGKGGYVFYMQRLVTENVKPDENIMIKVS